MSHPTSYQISPRAEFQAKHIFSQDFARPDLVAWAVRERDKQQRQESVSIISENIVNVGSESHPNWEVQFQYSDGSTYSYAGGNYHG